MKHCPNCLSSMHYSGEDYEVRYYTNLIKKHQGQSNPYLQRASNYIVRGGFTLALADLNKALELNPNNDTASRRQKLIHDKLKQKALMIKKILYLDVDGVLLGKNSLNEVTLAPYAKEFLSFCLENFKCYWLTTHCKDGEIENVIRQIKEYADDFVIGLIRQILPTTWETLKTEVIDFTSDFFWVDDSPLQYEIEQLKMNNVFHRWIEVNTRKCPDDLKRAMSILSWEKL